MALDAILVQMIEEITNKVPNLITIKRFTRNSRKDRYPYLRGESSNHDVNISPMQLGSSDGLVSIRK